MFKQNLIIFMFSISLCTTLKTMQNEPKTPENQQIENDDSYTPTNDRYLNCLFQFVLMNDPESFQIFLGKQPENLYKEITGGPYKGQSPYHYILKKGLRNFLDILYETGNIQIQDIKEYLHDEKRQKDTNEPEENIYELIESEDTFESLNPETKKWMELIVNQEAHQNQNKLIENNTNRNNNQIIEPNLSEQKFSMNPTYIDPNILFECIFSNDLQNFEYYITHYPATIFVKNSQSNYSKKTPYDYILKYGYTEFLEVLYQAGKMTLNMIKENLLKDQLRKETLHRNLVLTRHLSKKVVHSKCIVWMSKKLYSESPDYIFIPGLINALEVLYNEKIVTKKIIKKYLEKNNNKEITLRQNIENWIKVKLQAEGKKNLETIIYNKFQIPNSIKKIQENSKKILGKVIFEQKIEALCNHLEQKNNELTPGKSFVMVPFYGLVEENNFKKISK